MLRPFFRWLRWLISPGSSGIVAASGERLPSDVCGRKPVSRGLDRLASLPIGQALLHVHGMGTDADRTAHQVERRGEGEQRCPMRSRWPTVA